MLGAAFVLAFFALVALILAWSRRLAGHQLASAGHLALAIACATATAVTGSLASDFASYLRLDEQQPVAEMFFERTGSRQFRATLTRLPEGRMQVFELPGDQWRIDARTLRWKNEAARLEWASRYRLERLSTRDTSADTGLEASVAGFDLNEDRGADVWTRSREGWAWSRQADAQVAYGPWRRMANGARFAVHLRDGKLYTEPSNEAAAASVE